MSNAQNHDPVENENSPSYSDDGVNPVEDPVPGYRDQSLPPECHTVERPEPVAFKECATPDDVKEEIRRVIQAIYDMAVEDGATRNEGPRHHFVIEDYSQQLDLLQKALPYIGYWIPKLPPKHQREMAEMFTHITLQAAKERDQFYVAAGDNLVSSPIQDMVTDVQEGLICQSHIKLAETARRLGGPNLAKHVYIKGRYIEWCIRYAIQMSRGWEPCYLTRKREASFSLLSSYLQSLTAVGVDAQELLDEYKNAFTYMYAQLPRHTV